MMKTRDNGKNEVQPNAMQQSISPQVLTFIERQSVW